MLKALCSQTGFYDQTNPLLTKKTTISLLTYSNLPYVVSLSNIQQNNSLITASA